jgi:tetratricopeptide (TPR) repeat protein
MSFDKIKAMRNAERFLSQGKIRAAISEYKRIVEADPKDFGTLNILGDLYLKNAEQQEAVGCFAQVAEYYNEQGFSQKAIAVYNKISRLQPGSMEISAKLAHLYQSKGSYSEARTHYTSLAEDYQRKGLNTEALAIWKQIAELDPHDTGIYLKIAEIYWQGNQKDDAAKAYTEAGMRFSIHKKYESALAAFTKALEINRTNLKTLKGYVDAQIKLDCADEAAKILEEILEQQPYARDVLFLLIDCYVDTNNPKEAERAIIKLVEQEPANYPKFLELVEIYLKDGDLNSAARILSMSSEHLLVGGQSEEFLHWTNEILTRNPEHLDTLRLAVRYHGWHRDEAQLKKSLESLAEIARLNTSVEDERYALTQLVMIAPHETAYAQRLQEIKAEHGIDESDIVPIVFAAEPTSEAAKSGDFEAADAEGNIYKGDFGELNGDFVLNESDKFVDLVAVAQNGSNGSAPPEENVGEYIVEGVIDEAYTEKAETKQREFDDSELKAADQLRLEQEIESVEFYIAQGYTDLAEKSLSKLEEEFGNRKEVVALRSGWTGTADLPDAKIEPEEVVPEIVDAEEIEVNETDAKGFDILDEFKTDLGFEETEAETDDYDTHYHLAIAYKEMGLMEDAAREFQDAINLAKPDDGTRRFFQCANLLGHCFMEKAMPNLALMWYQRGLETPDLSGEEKQALYYEIAVAYEIGGDSEKAVEYFEKIYAENVDYRDVSGRLESFQE